MTASGFAGKKGPVLATAVVAGVQGAKRTSSLIPFCHPVALDACDVSFEESECSLEVTCAVTTTHRTGVEMEALSGASIAALAVYDMTKALSHSITIEDLRLIEKTGGKSDYRSPEPPSGGRFRWVRGDDDAKSLARLVVGAAMPDADVGFPVDLHAKYEPNVNTAFKGIAIAARRCLEDRDLHLVCAPRFRAPSIWL